MSSPTAGREQRKRAGLGAGRIHRAAELQLLLQRPVLGRRDRQCGVRPLPGRTLVQARPRRCAAAGTARRPLPGDLRPRRRAARLTPATPTRATCSAVSAPLPFVRASPTARWCIPLQPDREPLPQQRHSAGNTLAEAQVQCLSEIFERAVKRQILEGELALPDVPPEVLAKYRASSPGSAAWKSRASRYWSRTPRWAANSR